MVALKSYIEYDKDTHFPIQNIPFGVFSVPSKQKGVRIGTAIGDHVLDLQAIAAHGLFDGIAVVNAEVFKYDTLGPFMALGRPVWRATRLHIQTLLTDPQHEYRIRQCLYPSSEVQMHMPVSIGDYTDFYASKEHATNVGTMFRGKENALMPNWVHIPVGYHGRASSVVISGTPIPRPHGLRKLKKEDTVPEFGPSLKLDFELEMGFLIGGPDPEGLGEPIHILNAKDRIFGVVLMNDWSARDIQAFEYVPLGPFLGKNFGTTISPWVVTMDTLEEFRTGGPKQDPQPAKYLRLPEPSAYDINLQASVKPSGEQEFTVLSNTNLKYMYWSLTQQLAHHSIGGCNMRTGDLCGTGTISGPTEDSYGSLLELTWNGTKPVTTPQGSRTFLQDGDELKLSGYCQSDEGYRVGFGECVGRVMPARLPEIFHKTNLPSISSSDLRSTTM